MQVMNSFVTLECKFVNNFKINTDKKILLACLSIFCRFDNRTQFLRLVIVPHKIIDVS